MPTDRYYLRNAQTHGLTPSGDGVWEDLSLTAGAPGGQVSVLANPTAGGTEIQFKQSGSLHGFIGPAAPAGGFTLTTLSLTIYGQENSMNDNVGFRCRVFKRSAAGVITEVGGGPFNDGVELGTSEGAMSWIADVTDTVFAQNDRILLRFYLTNVGTMAANANASQLWYDNGTSGGNGNSFVDITYTTAGTTRDLSPTLAGSGALAATLIAGRRARPPRTILQAIGRSTYW